MNPRAWLVFGAIAIGAWTATAGGCGGKVEVDGPAPNPSGTTAGAGGSTTTGTTTVGTTASAGGAGPSTSVVSSTGDVAPDGESSVSSGPPTCDFTGDCNTCVQCAAGGVCAGPSEACASDDACSQYANCVANCPPNANGCFDDCAQQQPDGHKLYAAFASCVLCAGGACTSDCAMFSYLCGK